jgi:hypothetical protein
VLPLSNLACHHKYQGLFTCNLTSMSFDQSFHQNAFFFVNLIWITNFYALFLNLGVCNMSKIPLDIYYLEQCYNEGKFKEISLKNNNNNILNNP